MKKSEICKYCGGDYVPKRRGAQKFCSNSCRSLNWKNNQQIKELKEPTVDSINAMPISPEKPSSPEKMSFAGIGNAAVGAMAFEISKNIFTSDANKPATKKDIEDLKMFFKSRFLPVNNLRKDINGRTPYYDVQSGNLVYF